MTAENIKKINEKYPVLLADLIEDSEDYISIVKDILKLNGLQHIRDFATPEEYEKELSMNPNLTPHIALVDFRFNHSVLTGLDVTRMLMQRAKTKRLQTKVIMITGYSNPETIIEFFHLGGFGWINKDRNASKEDLKARIQLAIGEIKDALEERAFLDELREEVHY